MLPDHVSCTLQGTVIHEYEAMMKWR